MTDLTRAARETLRNLVAKYMAKLVFEDTKPSMGYPPEGVEIWVAITRAAIIDKEFNAALGELSLRAQVLLIKAAEEQREGEPGGSPKSPAIAHTNH